MARKYKDNSVAPIVAIDFDGTISVGDSFPQPKEIRKFAKEVINFLVDCGIKVVIYTSRDVAINQDTYTVYDDITPMINFLAEHGVRYSAINKSIQFAPFPYNSRKIYAHMYVDDRGYGWIESGCALLYVLNDIIVGLCGICKQDANNICAKICRGEDVSLEAELIAKHLKNYWV